MKKVLCLAVVAVLFCDVAMSQGVRIPLFDKAEGRHVEFGFEYSSKVPGGTSYATVTTGTVSMEGQKYIVIAKDMKMELRSDGASVWTVDKVAKEIVVEPAVNDLSAGVFTNPALLLGCYSDYFSVKGNAGHYTLIPVKGNDVTTVDLAVKGESGAEATLSMKDGSTYRFIITDLRFSDKTDGAVYNYSTSSLGKDWIVTDLR